MVPHLSCCNLPLGIKSSVCDYIQTRHSDSILCRAAAMIFRTDLPQRTIIAYPDLRYRYFNLYFYFLTHRNSPYASAITCGKDSMLTLDNYHLMVKGTCTYKYGQKCSYECHNGYLATDIMTRECMKSGSMSPPFSACNGKTMPTYT